MQPGDRALHHREARAAELDGGVEVQPQPLAHVDVVLGLEVEVARRAPRAHLHVAALAFAHRHAFVRQVGDGQQQRLHVGLDLVQALRGALELGLDAGDLGHHGIGRFTLGLELADLLGELVALGLQLLGAALDGLALGFERLEGVHVQVGLRRLARLEPGDHGIQVFA